MLFQVSNHVRGGTAEQEQAMAVYDRWKPPSGLEIKGMWVRADGGVVALIEATSSEALLRGTSAFAGSLPNYEIMPVVEAELGMALLKEGMEFRKAK